MYPMGPFRLLYRLYRYIFPAVQSELHKWENLAAQIPDPELRSQALSSISHKSFHCEGGCVYAAADLTTINILIPLITAYQTISDYLDNLCDRSTSNEPANFARLHQAMLDAVSGTGPTVDYYEFNREKDDGGYLIQLVNTCTAELRKLSAYSQVKGEVYRLASLYCDLQVHKHVEQPQREPRLLTWWKENQASAPLLRWNEFAAAAGSTLGIFHLFQLATWPDIDQGRVRLVLEAYFPWICSLHILLDYLVDLEEDRLGGDLNFISYYHDPGEIFERFQFVIQQARQKSRLLPDYSFHSMIIDGLLGLYLSDGKVQRLPHVKRIAKDLIHTAPLRTRLFFLNSRGYRGSRAILQPPRK